MKTLREKVQSPAEPVLFYELIPPAKEVEAVVVEAYAECAAELVDSVSVPIDAVNLPEIRAERRSAERTHPYELKADQRQFAKALRCFNDEVDWVVNRCTVYDAWDVQQEWLEETRQRFGIQNVILVGGESSRLTYPGPSVTDMAKSIHYVYGDAFFCGGVTIPTRRSPDSNKDEAYRLLEKGRHGLAYFTSQVLYEPHSIQRLLLDYDRLCREKKVTPCRIFLSFAPLSSRKDLDFLRWLGVEVPGEVERTLLKADIGVGWRSLKVANRILDEVLAFVADEGIQVPLGLNIEHITRHNFELSKELIDQLGTKYRRSLIQHSPRVPPSTAT